MRRITIPLRLIKAIHELGVLVCQSMCFSTFFVFDVRFLGAFTVALIISVWLWKPEPVKLCAPSKIDRGKAGVHVISLAIAPKGGQMATTTMEGQVALRTPNGADQTEQFLDFPGYARTVSFSPDGQYLAAAGIPPGIYMWDLRSTMGRPAKVLSVPVREVHCMVFSPDGRYLAVSTFLDNRICIWDIVGNKVQSMLFNSSSVASLAVSPDGRWLATGGRKRSLTLWDLPIGSRCDYWKIGLSSRVHLHSRPTELCWHRPATSSTLFDSGT